MNRADMTYGQAVLVRLPSGIKSQGEQWVHATILRPITTGLMADCVDVRLNNGEIRMVHCSRIEPLDAVLEKP
jgi:hypothetical protein